MQQLPLVSPPTDFAFPLAALGGQVVLADDFDEYEVAYKLDPTNTIEESGLSLELQWDLENATLTSLTSYRSYEQEEVPTEWVTLDLLDILNDAEQDTFTQEFRIAGNWGNRVNYVAGLYYFDQELDSRLGLTWGEDGNTFLLGGATLGALDSFGFFGPAGAVCSGLAFPGAGVEALCPLPALLPGEGKLDTATQEQTSWAVFGQADIQLTENLIATIGLRYLDEEKEMSVTFEESVFTPAFAAISLFSPFIPDLDGVKFDDTAVTGTAKLTYFWNDDFMSYVSYGRGYKSGGTNIDRIPPQIGAQQLFDPETSDSFEVGFKGDFMDKRLRVNAAAFLHRI